MSFNNVEAISDDCYKIINYFSSSTVVISVSSHTTVGKKQFLIDTWTNKMYSKSP